MDETDRRNHLIRVFRTLFDAHADQVCMLALDGTIIGVNRSWLEFGAANGLARGYTFEGVNYLDVCTKAAEQGDAIAQQALTGLLDVLATGRPQFVLSYPCHAPWQRRWFKLWVEPQMPHVDAVIVAHQLERTEPTGVGLGAYGQAGMRAS